MIFFMLFTIIFIAMGFGGFFLYNHIKGKLDGGEDKEEYIPTTQDNLPIDYTRRGIVKMKNGSYAAVISVPSINIDLMEGDEKEGVLQQYRGILQAIDFPFQFLQQSRVVDISDYLDKLDKKRLATENVFTKYQLEQYTNFLQELVSTRSVLTKKFFIIVSFDVDREKDKTSNQSSSVFDLSFDKKKKNKEKDTKDDVLEEERRFEIAFKQLDSRVNTLVSLFSKFEINPKQLNDDELTELYYTMYNKNRSVYQPIKKGAQLDYTSLYVKNGGSDFE